MGAKMSPKIYPKKTSEPKGRPEASREPFGCPEVSREAFWLNLALFPSFGRQICRKKCILTRKLQGLVLFAKVETPYFTCRNDLFRLKIFAK